MSFRPRARTRSSRFSRRRCLLNPWWIMHDITTQNDVITVLPCFWTASGCIYAQSTQSSYCHVDCNNQWAWQTGRRLCSFEIPNGLSCSWGHTDQSQFTFSFPPGQISCCLLWWRIFTGVDPYFPLDIMKRIVGDWISPFFQKKVTCVIYKNKKITRFSSRCNIYMSQTGLGLFDKRHVYLFRFFYLSFYSYGAFHVKKWSSDLIWPQI